MKYLAAAAVVLPLGYTMRFWPGAPEWLRDSAGGAAYVMLCALLAGALSPGRPALALAAMGLGFTCAVEFLQLWHPAWLDALRRTLPGRLVLGTTFAWGDFPPYGAGAVLGYAVLRWLRGKREVR